MSGYPPPQYSAYPAPQSATPQPYQGVQVSQAPVVYQQPPGPVIMSQPTTTIVNNNTSCVTNEKPAQQVIVQPVSIGWSTSFLDCFQDIPSCVLGLLCPPCLACWIASRYQESCCLGWCGTPTLTALRTKIRVDFKIQGSICDDCICVSCCTPFTLCQMHRELNQRRIP